MSVVLSLSLSLSLSLAALLGMLRHGLPPTSTRWLSPRTVNDGPVVCNSCFAAAVSFTAALSSAASASSAGSALGVVAASAPSPSPASASSASRSGLPAAGMSTFQTLRFILESR
jgi:hypothetical protein